MVNNYCFPVTVVYFVMRWRDEHVFNGVSDTGNDLSQIWNN